MLARSRSLLMILAVCWVVLFWRLGHVGLMDDEAHYAKLTQEMAAHGDWLVPRLSGTAFIDKPVFFHWVQGVTTAVASDRELGTRLPSALAALALFGVVWWFGCLSGGPGTGRGAWLMLATMPATFLLGRTGYMDMLFSALLFGAVALLTRAMTTHSRWQQAGAAVCIALAVMTKGPVAAALIGAWGCALWLIGGAARPAVARLNLIAIALGVCALAAPWFIWMYSYFGEAFTAGYLGRGHVDYFTPRASASSSQWSFYLQNFMTSFFPWSLIATGYGVDTLRRWKRGEAIALWETAMWLWMAVVLAAFTVVPFRVDRYIYPAAAACGLLAVRGWLTTMAGLRWQESIGTRVAVGLTAVVFIGAGASVWSALPSLGLPLPKSVGVLPAFMVVGGLAMAVTLLRQHVRLPRLAGWPVFTLVAAYACVVVYGLPVLRAGLPVEQLGRFVAEQVGVDEPVAVLGLDRWDQGLTYYLEKPPTRVRDAKEARRFASGPGPRWMVMRKDAHEGSAVGGCVTYSVPAIVGTKGRGIRTQIWEDILVVRFDGSTTYLPPGCKE